MKTLYVIQLLHDKSVIGTTYVQTDAPKSKVELYFESIYSLVGSGIIVKVIDVKKAEIVDIDKALEAGIVHA